MSHMWYLRRILRRLSPPCLLPYHVLRTLVVSLGQRVKCISAILEAWHGMVSTQIIKPGMGVLRMESIASKPPFVAFHGALLFEAALWLYDWPAMDSGGGRFR